jgi:hypothetical protein
LTELYVEQQLSMDAIAVRYGCMRQAVFKKMRAWGIMSRTRTASRNLTLAARGIQFYRPDGEGQMRLIRQRREQVNDAFFDTWTPAMAWVLGVIATDGCLHKIASRDR